MSTTLWLEEHPDAQPEWPPGTVLGPYRIEGLIGRGAMGVVYRARHGGLDRVCALKLLATGGPCSEVQAQRFAREAQVLARLDHPHVVPILDAGVFGGQPYYAMAWIEGQDLETLLVEGPPELRQGLEYLRQVAEAMAAAHAAGIIHRDLKPANILIGRDGRAYVADFGLALAAEDDRRLTITGGIVGTPSYMAPEQIQGRREEVGPATDVFALGVVLYRLITGRLPFEGQDIPALAHAIVHEDPADPMTLRPHTLGPCPRDAARMALKSLEKEPAERYADARALADDLARFLHFQPIAARARGPWSRLKRWTRRHDRLALAVIGATAVLLLSAGALAARLADLRAAQAARQTRETTLRRRQAAEAQALARAQVQDQVDAYGLRGETALRCDDPRAASLAFARALVHDPRDARARAGIERAVGLMVDDALRERQYALARYFLDDLAAAGVPSGPSIAALRQRLQALLEALPARARAQRAAMHQAITTLPRGDVLTRQARMERQGYLLAAFPSEVIGPLLLEDLEHDDPGVREAAATVCLYTGYRPAVDALLRCAVDEQDIAVLAAFAGAAAALAPKDEKVHDALLRLFLARPDAGPMLIEMIGRLDVLDDDPEQRSLDGWNQRGAIYIAAGRYDEAAATYAEALERFPEAPDSDLCLLHTHRGLALRSAGKAREALPDLRRACELDPKNESAANNLGLALNDLGDLAGAVAAFSHSIEIKDAPSTRINRANVLEKLGQAGAARADLDHVLEQNPDTLTALLDRGELRARQGDRTGALEDFLHARRLAPQNAHLHFLCGGLRTALGAYAEAVKDLDQAIALAPRHIDAYLARAAAQAALEHPREARRDLDQAISLDPRDWRAYAQRGMLRERLGDQGALSDYEQALALTGGRHPGLKQKVAALRKQSDSR